MAPFNRSCSTFYQSVIVSITIIIIIVIISNFTKRRVCLQKAAEALEALSCTILQIFDVGHSPFALQSYTRSVHCWNPGPNDPWPGDPVPSLPLGLSTSSSTQRAPEKLYRVKWCVTVVQDHSRSSKLVPIENPYAISLLVFYCNNVPIFYRFRNITIYRSKICDFSPFLPSSVSFGALAIGVPCGMNVMDYLVAKTA